MMQLERPIALPSRRQPSPECSRVKEPSGYRSQSAGGVASRQNPLYCDWI